MIVFGGPVCRHPVAASRREWLVTPGGCITQAWSAAEVLGAWAEPYQGV
ncbi:MAG: hypothetical protein JXB15_11500 [Anaerolineales bacterium]|nr:hypothetical protein [Anaerolineales bacterium]